MKKIKVSTVLFVLGVLFLGIAGVIEGYLIYDEYRADWEAKLHAQAILDELDVRMHEEYYKLDPTIPMPTVTIDGWDYIGYLHIPSLDITLPVIDQWSYPALKIAPARYQGSAYLDNLIIAGHNYRSHFGNLKELAIGDVIEFNDMDDNLFRYTVSEINTLDKYAIEEMEAGDWDLTLFTCTYGGQGRVTVRCQKLEETSYPAAETLP